MQQARWFLFCYKKKLQASSGDGCVARMKENRYKKPFFHQHSAQSEMANATPVPLPWRVAERDENTNPLASMSHSEK
jgi:hypothetical protein